MLPDKFEMIEHRMAGERAELSCNAQHHRFRVDALKLDLALAEIGFHARQCSEKIVVPERATEFSVGDGTETDLFLLPDRSRDFAILDRLQFSRRRFHFFSRLARASLSGRVRKRLPTWSARKGGAVRGGIQLSAHARAAGSERHFPHTSSASSTIIRSFAHCSSSARMFPSSVEAKPHWGDRHS